MRKVILMVDTGRDSGRKFLRGIERYMRAEARWEVCVQPPHYLPRENFNVRSWFHLQEADGLIARDSQHAANILNLKISKVINDTRTEVPEVSQVYTNSEQIGRLAADYLAGLGFRHFAFCGFEGLAWSNRRYAAFARRLENLGYGPVFNYSDWPGSGRRAETERWNIAEWLKTLPRPVCIFTCNDDRGINVLEACKIMGLRVPEEAAVLGVDNDELICDLSSPPLSSIEMNFERCGFECARLLEEMMSGRAATGRIVIEPVEVVTRQSTDVLAVEDAEVARALAFIRANYPRPIQVRDVVAATVLSRRDLELKFKSRLKRSIREEINRLRIESVKRKLACSGETIGAIAASLEYTDPEHFSRFFRRGAGCSPSEYRRTHKQFS